MTWDFEGEGTLYAADVGQHLFEEVNVITKGGNYGWNIKEGTHCFSPDSSFNPPEECPDTGEHGDELLDPVIEYLNVKAEDGLGSSVIGGYIYRGAALPDFEGDYIFGDYSRVLSDPRGRLFVATPEDENGLWPMREIPIANAANEELGHYLLGFGQDHEGELYILVSQSTAPTGDTGRVFKLVPADEGTDLAAFSDNEAEPTQADDEEAGEEVDEEATDEDGAESMTIDLVAENIDFDRETITVPAGARS